MPKVRGTSGQWVMGGVDKPRKSLRARLWAKRKHQQLRDEMLNAYGNICWCCSETESKFLTLDHLRNDGYIDRKLMQNGTALYTRLQRAGWPKDGYALACYNCNCGRAQNGGICPHRSLVHAS